MQKKSKKKIKRHIKWKSFFFFLCVVLFIYLIGYFFLELRVKNIYIVGNDTVKDYEIIEASGLKEYPKMFKYSTRTLEKNIASLDLIANAKVKKSILGKVTIQVEEARVLFYNRNNSTYVLSNGVETIEGEFTGVPFLNNYVTSNIYERLVKELATVKPESLALISEIEYSPSKSGDVVLDDTRFLLRMNDGNHVYINLVNIDRLDLYAISYTVLTEKGTLYLDSDNGSAFFQKFGETIVGPIGDAT